MIKRSKYDFPDVAQIFGVKFNIKKLRKEVSQMKNEWNNVYDTNRGLCSLHSDLADKVYFNLKQIPLTWFSSIDSKTKTENDIINLKSESLLNEKNLFKGKSLTKKYSLKLKKAGDFDPCLDERNWIHPTKKYKDSFTEVSIKKNFKGSVVRVKFTKLKAKNKIPTHIDYPPSYATRVIIPIQGVEGCINKFIRKGEIREYYLPADGSAYFLNIGLMHSVEHSGVEDRIVLMFSLIDQVDLQGMKSIQPINCEQI